MTDNTTTAAERVREAAERLQRIANGELGVAVYFPDHRGSVHANNTLDRAADLARDDRRTLADAYLAQQPTYEQQAAEIERLKEESQWIRRKLKLPEDASSSDVYGQMHVLDSNSHGFSAYIAAYKCDDKQGEIARLTHANAAQSAEIAELRAKVEAAEEKAEFTKNRFCCTYCNMVSRKFDTFEEACAAVREHAHQCEHHPVYQLLEKYRPLFERYDELKAKEDQLTALRARTQAFDDERLKGFRRCIAELLLQARRRRATAYELSGDDRTVPIEVARELENLAAWLDKSAPKLLAALGGAK